MVLLTGYMKVSWTILISRGQKEIFVYKTSKKSLLQTSIVSLALLCISCQDIHAVLLHVLTCCLAVIHIFMHITHMLYGE